MRGPFVRQEVAFEDQDDTGNQWFCQRPGVALEIVEGLSRIGVRLSDGVIASSPEAVPFFEGSATHVATVDVQFFPLLTHWTMPG